ncbi:tRNA glutamyl-Q(34) synthetase GluQRS [Panacagrimonas perspica]|nr:tRNA glutamyl-Q(34) synthetase GluQRS [Panacagrimonas perspica]THD05312.1 tRNA glutamyl-Q(34) synthetase GluQRS [Panacagrimonas perspica]
MTRYVGRFAPTPSGALHFGSLVTALGSWLDARASGGSWLLRIDDLDTARVKAGADAQILHQLDEHGLNWDGIPRRQSEHLAEYQDAVERLQKVGLLYACRCTRAQLAAMIPQGQDDPEPIYPGTCRDAGLPDRDAALRFRVPSGSPISDFVVRRRDGAPAYQLACAVDEAAQGITDVVRGADLMSSGIRQQLLMQALGLPIPRYRHLPLVLDPSGRKLGKRNESRPLEAAEASANVAAALAVLGQAVPVEAQRLPVSDLTRAAIDRWRPDQIPSTPHKVT